MRDNPTWVLHTVLVVVLQITMVWQLVGLREAAGISAQEMAYVRKLLDDRTPLFSQIVGRLEVLKAKVEVIDAKIPEPKEPK